jgi:hypothetical protein
LSECTHTPVRRLINKRNDSLFEDKWECSECRAEFFRYDPYVPPIIYSTTPEEPGSDKFSSGKIQFIEPRVTLRDQFAMTALQGLLASCHGPALDRDVLQLGYSAYVYADQMMKERIES